MSSDVGPLVGETDQSDQPVTGDLVSLGGDSAANGDQKPAVVFPVNHTPASEPLIVHAGAVVSMLHLLPSIACRQQPQVIDIVVYLRVPLLNNLLYVQLF